MTLIVGASKFLNTAILANKTGASAVTPNLLAGRGTVDMLDVARRVTANNGIGLSDSARQLNRQFLNSAQANYNAIFGLSTSGMSTVQAMIQKINAIRASLPESQIREDLRGVVIDPDSGNVSGSSTGNVVDEEA